VEKEGTLFISPVQYNSDTDKFVITKPIGTNDPGCSSAVAVIPQGSILRNRHFQSPLLAVKPVTAKVPGMLRRPRQSFIKDEDVNKLNEDLKKIQAAMDWGAKTKP